MLPLTDAQIRTSFINATRSERGNVLLPAEFDATPWDRLDYLGWRNPKLPQVGYIVAELDGAVVGLILREADTRARSRPQCSWCRDVELPNDVVLFTTKRTGDAGRKGDTVGTLICAHFECSRNVRRLPPSAYLGFDREAARDRRIDALRDSVAGFLRDIRDGA
jgi:hypothetical protein